MMRMKKGWIGLLLCAAMAMCLAAGALAASDYALNVQAAFQRGALDAQYQGSGDYLYLLDEKGGAALLNYWGPGGEIAVPAEIDGHPVTLISAECFKNDASLTGVTIPAGIKTIGLDAFSGCGSLSRVELSEGLEQIYSGAFAGCHALRDIALPASVRLPDGNPFLNDLGLMTIRVAADSPYEFRGMGEHTPPMLILKESKTLIWAGYTGETVVLPADIAAIGKYALSYDPSSGATLKSVTLPEGLTRIGERAFYGDRMLESVNLPAGLKTIGTMAFYHCDRLDAALPAGLETLGGAAFWGCGLTEVKIPAGVRNMPLNPFVLCEKLTEMTVDPENTRYEMVGELLFDKAQKRVVCAPAGMTAKELAIPEGTEIVGEHAFYHMTGLRNVSLPAGLKEIRRSAFIWCENLEAAMIPEGVTVLGDGAYGHCGKLQEVFLPQSLTTIGAGVFPTDARITLSTVAGSAAEAWAKEKGFQTETVVPVAGLTLDQESVAMHRGKGVTLNAMVQPRKPSNPKLEWSSSNENVARVNNRGRVTGVAGGECDVTVRTTDGSGLSAVCHVTIVERVSEIRLQPSRITIPFGAEVTGLTVTVRPENPTNGKLAWSSSDEKICTVDENGKIVGVGAGNCVITASSTDGSRKSAKVKIHVSLFSEMAGEYTVTEKTGLVIPVDLHGVAPEKVNARSQNGQYFRLSLDGEGLHIQPAAAGTTKVTLTNTLNWQDKTEFTVTVAESAVP